MGSRAECIVNYGGRITKGEVLLESEALIFQGDCRFTLPFKSLTAVEAENGKLRLTSPQGIVVSADGRRGYVANYLSRNVQVLDSIHPRSPAVISTVAVTGEPLSANVANGKRLFYRATR